MAKAKAGLIKVVGKLDGHVITSRGDVRKQVESGTKKHEAALKQQYTRTGFLNKLASDINIMIREHSDGLKSRGFYQDLLSCLRQEPENNRLLLLQQLKGMEINPAYPFSIHGMPGISCTADTKKLRVRLRVGKHPFSLQQPLTDYYYEVLFASWNRKPGPGDCERQYSEWVHKKDRVPVFEFDFERPAGALHWLVCVRIRLGSHEVPAESFKADGMQIIDAGSFDKREQAWLLERKEAAAKPVARVVKQVKEIVRVKAVGG